MWGPNFIVNDQTGDVRGVDWIFQSWGGLYFPYDWDDQVARKVLKVIQPEAIEWTADSAHHSA